jgi:adenylosuccinate lyase
MGKRAGLWLQDVLSDIEEIDFVLDTIKFLGCRGTTGTEASFMELFEGNEAKIDEMNSLIANSFGFNECFTVSGQTYPRKFDSRIMNALSSVAQSVYRMANDIRLLQHDKQLEENFSEHQVGSSAMAYKRNPIHAERICSLARYLMTDALNAHLTASLQWLERTLDDSANRRISLPEGFLCADSIIRLSIDLINHLHVNEKVVAKFLNEYLPFIATENIMMEAVKRGGDRQQVHEIIRSCSMDATAALSRGESADLLKKLAEHKELHLSEDEIRNLADPSLYIGRCPSQVDNLIARANSVIDDSDFTDTDEII